LEDRKVDGRIYVLLLLNMMMKGEQVEIDVVARRRMEFVLDCVRLRNST
jgi:hypothetical protein